MISARRLSPISWFVFAALAACGGDASDGAAETAALVRTEDGYDLYYSGYRNLDQDGNRPGASLGLATSTDGEMFVRVGSDPLLEPAPGGPDGDDIFSAVPFRDGAALRMVRRHPRGHPLSPSGDPMSTTASSAPYVHPASTARSIDGIHRAPPLHYPTGPAR